MIKGRKLCLTIILLSIISAFSCYNPGKPVSSSSAPDTDTVAVTDSDTTDVTLTDTDSDTNTGSNENTGIVVNSAPVFSYDTDINSDTEPSDASGLITESDGAGIVESLTKNKVYNAYVDLNVRITVPASENPDSETDIDLWATVIRPAGGKKLPTIVLATPYRREIMMIFEIPFVSYGYNLVAVDIRGTGSSSDVWDTFGLKEQYDIRYVVDEYIPAQSWSDGKIGMIGGSYMGIIQLLTAGLVDTDPATGEPVHLKAIFPLAPMSDVYRDIVMHGGNVDFLFIPAWLGMVDIFASLPSLLNLGINGKITKENIQEAYDITKAHINFIPTTIGWIMDPDHMNYGDFYKTRSTMQYWPDKPAGGWGYYEGDNRVMPSSLPVFEIGGWFDIFTRGTFNSYQYGLKNQKQADKRLIIGEYYHLEAATGIGNNSLFTRKLPARWFDWKIKGKDTPVMEEYPVLLYVMGENRWRGEKSWPLAGSRTSKQTLYMTKNNPATAVEGDWYSDSDSSEYDNNNYALSGIPDFTGENPVVTHNPLNLHGANSRASVRWLMGIEAIISDMSKLYLGYNIDAAQWFEDERNDEKNCLTFTTEPLAKDTEIIGPLTVTFWAKTRFSDSLASIKAEYIISVIKDMYNITDNLVLDMINKKDVQWITELNDVFENGRARNITSGWLAACHRPYDPAGTVSEYYDSDNNKVTEHALDPAYTPFDPFYFKSYENPELINDGELYQYTVELWPTCNVFKKGHRIRVSLSTSDFPHLLPVIQPSTNTIVIDEKHVAKVDFTTTNNINEGTTWKWIGDNNDADDYVLSGSATGCGTQAVASQHNGSAVKCFSGISGLLFIMMFPLSLIFLRKQFIRIMNRRRV